MFRDLDGPVVLNIQPPQLLVVADTGLEVEAIQILRQIDQLLDAAGIFAAVYHGLELLQIGGAHIGEQMGQMVELVEVFILAQVVIQAQHIAVKRGNENLLISNTVHADPL